MRGTGQVALALDQVQLSQAVFENGKHVRELRRRVLKLLLLYAILGLVGLFVVALVFHWQFDLVWRYETVGLIGASVGTAELLSRYRDAPSFVLLSPPGIGYIALNVAASLIALAVIRAFGWKFGASGSSLAATQVLTGGFGAMALFRSSLLTVKAGSDDVGIGPSSVLSIMMAASDRSADRLRAADRAGRVHEIMGDVSYAKAQDSLPTVAVALMQNLSPTDVAALNADLDALKTKDLLDSTKALLLGLKLTNVVSTSVLAAAKASLRDAVLVDGDAPSQPPTNGGGNGGGSVAERVVVDATARPFASEGLPQTPQTPEPAAHDGAPQ
jgi:hypothetical protein